MSVVYFLFLQIRICAGQRFFKLSLLKNMLLNKILYR